MLRKFLASMLGNTLNFENGSAITWTSRESVRYMEAGYEVEVWVDLGKGFLSRKRVIKSESLRHWTRVPPNASSRDISSSKRAAIIEKIRKYYAGRPVEVE